MQHEYLPRMFVCFVKVVFRIYKFMSGVDSQRVLPEQLPSYSGSEISGWTTKWVSLNVSISTALDSVCFNVPSKRNDILLFPVAATPVVT